MLTPITAMPIENVAGVHRPVTTGLNADPQVRGDWQQGMEIIPGEKVHDLI
jgi:hypothetical protein